MRVAQLKGLTIPLLILALGSVATTTSGAKMMWSQSGTGPGNIVPNLAVDDSVVAQLQALVQQECESEGGVNKGMDCRCMADRAPAERLRQLSDAYRHAERTQPQVFADLSLRETQVNFGTEKDKAITARSRSAKGVHQRVFSMYAALAGVCRDGTVKAQQFKERCVGTASTLPNPYQGRQSAEKFCACAAANYKKAFERPVNPTLYTPTDPDMFAAAYEACGAQ